MVCRIIADKLACRPKHYARATDKKVTPSLDKTKQIIIIRWMRSAMDNRNVRYKLPKNVDEAAELLLSDMLMQHLKALSNMSEQDFNLLCDRVAPYLIEEFKLWAGNEALLDSCFTRADIQETDPARIILNRVKQMLNDFHGFLVIT